MLSQVEQTLLAGFDVFKTPHAPCPYFNDGRLRGSFNFFSPHMDSAVYERLIPFGWRRCGTFFYKSVCKPCSLCRPMRVIVDGFKPNRAQRRALQGNRDLEVSVQDASYSEEDFDLYRKYCAVRHPGGGDIEESDFRQFLVDTPLQSLTVRFRKDGLLVGVGWTDVLPNSLSLVYFAFDPELHRRSLGVLSIVMHIGLCRQLGLSRVCLGFHIEGCRKMEYKSLYRPCEIGNEGGAWTPFECFQE